MDKKFKKIEEPLKNGMQRLGNLFGHPTCYGCEKPIEQGEYIQAEGYCFHTDHFICFKCSKPLNEGYVMYQHHAYCKQDFLEYCQPKCSKCNEPITETALVAVLNGKELRFHPRCFTCNNCGSVIDGGYSLDENGNIVCFRCPPQYLFPQKPDKAGTLNLRKI